eukprot:TRINITY_DN557_c0_g1_i2.p1 TRINITY_DN557_c0_g1~~TRINITY_DN557_c0_g1_i2.p1  ORF type:complete len:271 (+),score=33.12 TRINITY_DN557_c0_g1_i2:177-989(+)
MMNSLVALVGNGPEPAFSARKLSMYNINEESLQPHFELSFQTPILAVKMSSSHFIVVLENKIHIYELQNVRNVRAIDTYPNPKGLCALSHNDFYLAYPGVRGTGQVCINDGIKEEMTIEAHKSSLSTLIFSPDGTLLATASQQGTLIRVFLIPEGVQEYLFRRGTSAAKIYSMSIDDTNSHLCVSSSTGTLHIFKMDAQSKPGSMEYLPDYIVNVWNPHRSVNCLQLPFGGLRSLCALRNSSVYLVTEDGDFCQYRTSEHELTLIKREAI